MDADVEYCRKNDKYGLYKLSDEGKISNLAGVDEKYDIPEQSDFVITDGEIIDVNVIEAAI